MDFQSIQNIAVFRTDRLGDLVLTLPMCLAIKKVLPNSNLTLVVRPYVKPLLYDCKVIDNIYYLENIDRSNLITFYKNNRLDAVFFPRPRFNEVYYAFKHNVTHRIGTAYRWYSFLFTFKVHEHRKTAEHNEAVYNIHLVSKFFGQEVPLVPVKINVNPKAQQKINELLETLGIKPYDYIVLHPGSGGSSLNWNPIKFAELAQSLISYGNKVVLTGNKNEIPLYKIIHSLCPEVINFIGRLDLYETIALISMAKGLVANSTGILHIASVNDVPVVGLYPNSPPLSPSRWGPIGKYSTTISPHSIDLERVDDMSLISPEEVFNELMNVIRLKESEEK